MTTNYRSNNIFRNTMDWQFPVIGVDLYGYFARELSEYVKKRRDAINSPFINLKKSKRTVIFDDDVKSL